MLVLYYAQQSGPHSVFLLILSYKRINMTTADEQDALSAFSNISHKDMSGSSVSLRRYSTHNQKHEMKRLIFFCLLATASARIKCDYQIIDVTGKTGHPTKFIVNTTQSAIVRCAGLSPAHPQCWSTWQVFPGGEVDLRHDPADYRDMPFTTSIPLDAETQSSTFYLVARKSLAEGHDVDVSASINYTVGVPSKYVTAEEISIDLVNQTQSQSGYSYNTANFKSSGTHAHQPTRITVTWIMQGGFVTTDSKLMPADTDTIEIKSRPSYLPLRVLSWTWEVENPEFPGTLQPVATITL
ncbi:hypothetical protein PROFUN_10145 [Planoprotostelium fungivorum]|uniref:Uncharacterized protein n=1 Tax=Planoprotostelium fungivorum TaxID=1890364 RepID=A0A2P6NEI5_9EUKA|nr:hypothetical protein PROFUN_10145 [Planoprotostelium fungivorum]